ncbi:MAG: hypothetical protein HQL23_06575 [Candidatus Omnitrophica bacterium]|nr:hypothetical protein [Candidatus Omnitrophota bacterium]
MNWESTAKQKYDAMIKKMPMFHRGIAEEVVNKEAENIAVARGAKQVEERDIVQAFQTEVPPAFFSLMTRLMDMVGFKHH